ncbi:YlmC/YmxH family sporulation protein [Thermohalobacter berrensis]|uniref:Photosystem reaction center protein H n=1 Tax=Thermohalobacter berrensis TaxID=99594 RepID=A0A419TA06_9FIRM|nr:YlmC/YmxH family sporulation protein [Thermohalobacter berrensis]RKD34310.1 photosystem reaction center protein H [Thermohalobacter berrensis]
MVKTSELKEKEVINIRDGSRLGLISDIEIDLKRGEIKAIVVPGHGNLFSLFNRRGDYIIEWRNIKKIGKDVILVDLSLNWEREDSGKNI